MAEKSLKALSNVYVTDAANKNVQKFDSSGKFITKWGSEGKGDGQFGQFASPWGIAVDSSANVYVTDHSDNIDIQRVQVFAPSNSTFKGKCQSFNRDIKPQHFLLLGIVD